jgi:GNAT superfamily N-acetyltransferase
MTGAHAEDIAIALLADHEHLLPALGELCWREWGHLPEPTNLDWWIETTRREAGREQLPVTWVALNGDGEALGRVGLGEFDIEERRDRSPWVLGMIVQPAQRGKGIGGRLLAELECGARARGYSHVWVATGGHAIDFYRKCGWTFTETINRPNDEVATILMKVL